jgi:hypothetical protein
MTNPGKILTLDNLLCLQLEAELSLETLHVALNKFKCTNIKRMSKQELLLFTYLDQGKYYCDKALVEIHKQLATLAITLYPQEEDSFE